MAPTIPILAKNQLTDLLNTVDKIDEMNYCQIMNNFDYRSLYNISIVDYKQARLTILILKKLIVCNAFYDHQIAVQSAARFVVMNIPMLEKVKDINTHSVEILLSLLGIIKILLQKSKNNETTKNYFIRKKEQLFNNLTTSIDFDMFNSNLLSEFNSVILEILTLDKPLNDELHTDFQKILQVYTLHKAYYEVTLLFEIIRENYDKSSRIFQMFAIWMLETGTSVLMSGKDELQQIKLLESVNCLYADTLSKAPYTAFMEELIIKSKKYLTEHSNMILLFFTKPNLRKESTKLFAYIVVFYELDKNWNNVYTQLINLPSDPTEWSRCDHKFFLKICYMLNTYSRTIWSSEEILNVIRILVYSNERFSISSNLLRNISYLYPYHLAFVINEENLTLGDDIMFLISKQPICIDKIFTLHISQLNWMLLTGNPAMKLAIIKYWFKNSENMEILKKCILISNSQNLLIDILTDKTLDIEIGLKVALLSQTISDPPLKEAIADLLPSTFGTPVFHRLMLADPGIPEDRDSALQLVEFMSLMLFFAADQQLFGMVCDYSKKLIVSFKADPTAVSLFCSENKNILWAMKRLKTFSDEVAISLMDFIRTLLLVQIRNKHFVENCMTDFSFGLSGSTAKMMACLDLLLVFTRPGVFIQISPNAIKSIFFQLFSLYRDKNLSVNCLVCMRRLMKRNPWLAELDTTHLFLETQCSLKVEENSCLEFIHFLYDWMKIFNQHSFVNKVSIEVQTDVIQSYVRRTIIELRNKPNSFEMTKVMSKLKKLEMLSTPALKL